MGCLLCAANIGMANLKRNQNGGVYENGAAYPPQIYNLVERALQAYMDASSRELASQFGVGKTFVCEVRNKLRNGQVAAPKAKGGDQRSRIQDPELTYLSYLYQQDNTRLLEEYRQELIPIYAPQSPPGLSTICRALNNTLVLPRKKLTWLEREKYTVENMNYYHNFCGALSVVDPVHIKSFDESHVDKDSTYNPHCALG